jgi:hypothetical protein
MQEGQTFSATQVYIEINIYTLLTHKCKQLQKKYDILMVASVKMIVCWLDAPCSLVEVYDVSETLMMEAASTSKTPRNLYQTTL